MGLDELNGQSRLAYTCIGYDRSILAMFGIGLGAHYLPPPPTMTSLYSRTTHEAVLFAMLII